MKLVVGATTDVGRVRDGNEDSFLVDDRLRLFALADGMGGHRAGEVASATALEALRASVAAGRPLDEAVVEANRAVYSKAAEDEALNGMGTTLTAIAIGSERAVVIGHVGDSRAYLVRDGDLEQITTDHSLVEEMVREGRITEEQALVHPQRSIVTRAVGIDAEIQVDLYPIELTPGDRLLLCSDGLTDMVRPADIARILRRETAPQRASEALADAANEAGGEDNVTAVVIAALHDDEQAAPGSTVVEAPPVDRPVIDPIPSPATPAPDTAAAAHAAAESRALRRVQARRAGRSAFRLLWWLLPVVLILAVAVGALWWHARRSFYVGLEADRVVVFRGVPGGLLGWDPTTERRTRLRASDLSSAQVDDLRNGHPFSSEASAARFVTRLSETTTTTTTTATTATTATTTATTLPGTVPTPPPTAAP